MSSSKLFYFFKKSILIGLLYKHFIENLLNFPNYLINACKQDVLNIELIKFNHEYSEVNITSSSTIDLSKLVDLCMFNLMLASIIYNNILIYFI